MVLFVLHTCPSWLFQCHHHLEDNAIKAATCSLYIWALNANLLLLMFFPRVNDRAAVYCTVASCQTKTVPWWRNSFTGYKLLQVGERRGHIRCRWHFRSKMSDNKDIFQNVVFWYCDSGLKIFVFKMLDELSLCYYTVITTKTCKDTSIFCMHQMVIPQKRGDNPFKNNNCLD